MYFFEIWMGVDTEDKYLFRSFVLLIPIFYVLKLQCCSRWTAEWKKYKKQIKKGKQQQWITQTRSSFDEQIETSP